MLDRIVINNGLKIQYRTHIGSLKTALIFLHGGGGSLSAWETIVDFFRDTDYTLIAVDLRGHGLSDKPKNQNEYDLERHTEDILMLMENESLAKVVLIGHCLGSMIAATFAAKYPKRVTKLILINTNCELPFFLNKPPLKQLLQFVLHLGQYLFSPKKELSKRVNYKKFIGSSDLDFRRIREDFAEMGIFSVIRQGVALLDWKGRQYMEKITTPTLVISGMRDRLYPIGTGEKVIKLIKRAEHVYVDSNHISIINNPKEVYDKILKFIQIA